METEAVEGERLGEPGKGVIDRRGGRGGVGAVWVMSAPPCKHRPRSEDGTRDDRTGFWICQRRSHTHTAVFSNRCLA